MRWECLPDSYKDGTLTITSKEVSHFKKDRKLSVFSVYASDPFQGRAYRPRNEEGGYTYILRKGKKVYIGGPRNPKEETRPFPF